MELLNKTIGKYRLTRFIGEGGMAAVYEGEHDMLGTKVAIKVLNPFLSANAQIRERFRNEAKLMASLNHPNITRVIDFDEQPQQLSIIMELLEGGDLNQKIRREGALSDQQCTVIFDQALSALQYAHEKGIAHRDIKPSNIFILPGGQVKLLDFGIAKLFGQGNEMTQTGTQMGTPTYMSPEQVKADKSIDHRSDIYSLGVTMYYALVGKAPYDSTTNSQFEIFNKIVFEPLPKLGSGGALSTAIEKACQKDREARFQSCFEFKVALTNSSAIPSPKEAHIPSIKETKKPAETEIAANSIQPLPIRTDQRLYVLIIAIIGMVGCYFPWLNFGYGEWSLKGIDITVGKVTFFFLLVSIILLFVKGRFSQPFKKWQKITTAITMGISGLIPLNMFINAAEYKSNGIILSIITGLFGCIYLLIFGKTKK